MQTEAVMTRYRELKKGMSMLEASVRVHQEAGRAGDLHWHRIHERCWCGYLTVPSAFYTYDDKGRQTNTQEDAEKKYLASLSPSDVPSGDNVPIDNMSGKPDLCECGKPNETGRSTCAACRKRAYRERSRG